MMHDIDDQSTSWLIQDILRDTHRTIVDNVHVDLRVRVHCHLFTPIILIVEDQVWSHINHEFSTQHDSH